MVLSPDLVRARRRGEALLVSEFKDKELPEVRALAESMLQTVQLAVGENLEEVDARLEEVVRSASHDKVWAGFKKILLELCEFTESSSVDPVVLRKTLFERAAAVRLAQEADVPFVRDGVVADVAASLGISVEELDASFFGDLKGAKRVVAFPQIGAEDLICEYQKQHLQGVLLRAVKLDCELECSDPHEFRLLFRKLKFRQLLFRVTELGPQNYRIEIEGPFSLFEAVTKYGMQFALVLPVLMECKRGKVVAELRWGKERRPLSYEKSWSHPQAKGAEGEELSLRPELETLLTALRKKKSKWKVEPWGQLLSIPGAGVCVSDLKFSAEGRPPVYLELMGFWSREAVWQRVEWAQAGKHERVIFAVSSRLRVSEEVLPEDSGGSLCVFKGTMSAAAVLEQVERLASRPE